MLIGPNLYQAVIPLIVEPKTNNNKEAINNLLHAIKIEKDSSKIYFNLAEMFLSIGDLNNSKKFFSKTIKLDQNHEAANFKK